MTERGSISYPCEVCGGDHGSGPGCSRQFTALGGEGYTGEFVWANKMGPIKFTRSQVPGYGSLRQVLDRAYDQAAAGKGAERHANDLPFEEQPILAETRAVGIGFVAGQARKKILEATRCWEQHPERAVVDLLGAINYIAAQIIYIEEQTKNETP